MPQSRRKPRGPVYKKYEPEFVEMKRDPLAQSARRFDETRSIPSVGSGIGVALLAQPERYDDPDLDARERAAQVEIERRRKCLAPAYNKGAYQLVWSKEDALLAGRK